MIKANFNTYASYVTDSLYQWDLNQKLSVSGLNLTVAPEVHFSNSNMDRAIVRQATLDNYIVSVDIPNSLLQEALTIKAHICIYDNDTLKVIELIEIPVNPRVRPLDYKIENTDGEIYSFNALENLINNKYDALVLNNEEILAEVEAITTGVQGNIATNSNNIEELQTQVDNKINKNLFSAWPALPVESVLLPSGNSHELGFAPNRLFILTIFNTHNQGAVYILETGSSATKVKVTQIKGDTTYFTVTPLTATSLSVTAKDANGYYNFMCLGGYNA